MGFSARNFIAGVSWRRPAILGSIWIEGFVPAVIAPDAPAHVLAPSNPVAGGGRMEMLNANGLRVIADRDVDALLRILLGL